MYCQNCGQALEDDANICPFCGFSTEVSNKLAQKDQRIEELQEKVIELEQAIRNTTYEGSDQSYDNKMNLIIMLVLPIAFLIFFFLLVFVLVNR